MPQPKCKYVLSLLGLSACVPTSLDPGSVQIIISSHDGLYQEGDIHTRNCSEDTGGKFQSESMIGSFPGYVSTVK